MIKAALPRGFVDCTSQDLKLEKEVMDLIAQVYEQYGFEPLRTPFFEYSEALGKFLPDDDRPNAGVFSLQDDDEQWLSLRYDLTAPLARFVAQNYETIIKPFKSYRVGPVFRNEKPGPGRYRQFIQFDADVVGSYTISTDVQLCMMIADSLEALGFSRNQYVIKFNNRKILDALLDIIGLDKEQDQDKRLQVLRSVDKFDKFGLQGVRELLSKGRLDESGDFTKGVGLKDEQIAKVLSILQFDKVQDIEEQLKKLEKLIGENEQGKEAVLELQLAQKLITQTGYDDRIVIDTTIVRGLEYYTGSVFEAQLLFDVLNDDGKAVVFGSVAGGGRYDKLVGRFGNQEIPATGISIGVSRLLVALKTLRKNQNKENKALGPVVILRMDNDVNALISYAQIADKLRNEGIGCEIYDGTAGMKAQMKYADRRNAPCVIIQGSREREENMVQIKDLIEGARLAKNIDNNEEWRKARPAQITVKTEDIIENVKNIINFHKNQA